MLQVKGRKRAHINKLTSARMHACRCTFRARGATSARLGWALCAAAVAAAARAVRLPLERARRHRAAPPSAQTWHWMRKARCA